MNAAHQDFWRELNPEFSICGTKPGMPTVAAIPHPELCAAHRQFDREGYYKIVAAQDPAEMARLATAIRRITANNLPAVFAFVYDEAWSVFRRLHPCIEQLLDAPVVALPEFWIWHVDPARDESGWRPHRDRGYRSLLPDKRPKSVTAWVPATEATTLNGCMYIVPAHWDATYGTPHDGTHHFDYRSIRALPAAAGEVFVWNHALLHWGSRASDRADAPRISMAMEFHRADLPADRRPLLSQDICLTFEQRLALISTQIEQYRHMHGHDDADLARFTSAHAARLEQLFPDARGG